MFAPLSLPADTEVSILPVADSELACSLENPKTRFRPSGYKEMTSNPPQGRLDTPARVYWKIPERYKSLDQLKFLTLSSKGGMLRPFDFWLRHCCFIMDFITSLPSSADSCDWTLKEDIRLETRASVDGQLEYWAYTDLADFSVFSLAQVEPLVSEPKIPHIITYTEGTEAREISPLLDLNVKEDYGWNDKYPNLRLKSMSISVSEGFVLGEDVLKFPEVPGFEGTWDAEQGVLTVAAVPGFDFTENTAEDYEDAQVETVDISEVLVSVEATATLEQFQEALRVVRFETSSAGSTLSRQMSLSANELLTSDTIATITMASLVNTPDPPIVIPSSSVLAYTEKAPLTPVDVNVEVSDW